MADAQLFGDIQVTDSLIAVSDEQPSRRLDNPRLLVCTRRIVFRQSFFSSGHEFNPIFLCTALALHTLFRVIHVAEEAQKRASKTLTAKRQN